VGRIRVCRPIQAHPPFLFILLYFLFLFFSLYSNFTFEFAQSSKLVLILSVQIEHTNMDGLTLFYIHISLFLYNIFFLFFNLQLAN
jgi:hypothetical protein